MDLKKRLEFCTKCQKRKFGDTGIVCSLSDRKPDFNDTCKDFLIDPKEAQKILAKKNYSSTSGSYKEESSSNSIWLIIAVVLFILKMIFRFMRD